jgi:hypothetical protein
MTTKRALTKRYTHAKDDAQKKFISHISFIIKSLQNKNAKDPEILKVADQFSIARKDLSNEIIEKTGPYLWKYRNEIKVKNEKFFLNNDYTKDLKELSKLTGELPELNELDGEPQIIQKVKRTWLYFNNLEKEVIWKRVQLALSEYAKFVQACKLLKDAVGNTE